MDSIAIVRKALNGFVGLFGLTTNPEKSHVFLLGVDDELEASLYAQSGFGLGSLPARYLRVPLISTRLKHSDCMSLLE